MYACVQIAQRARACHAGDSPRVRNSKVRIIWERATYIARVHAYARRFRSITIERYTRCMHGGTVLAVGSTIWSESLSTWTADRFIWLREPVGAREKWRQGRPLSIGACFNRRTSRHWRPWGISSRRSPSYVPPVARLITTPIMKGTHVI